MRYQKKYFFAVSMKKHKKERNMTGTTVGIFIVILVYLLGMIGIGIWFSKKTNDVNDFYLGGRKLGPLVTAMRCV